MPRPYKRRRICAIPCCGKFGPIDPENSAGEVAYMTLDEFESLRLIDLENRTQEQCAKSMNVARTTAQSIYNSARFKLTDCLVNKKELVIEGGDYVLCDGSQENCVCMNNCRHRCQIKEETGDDIDE